MGGVRGLLGKAHLLVNLGLLVWVAGFNAMSTTVRNGLLKLLSHPASRVSTQAGLLLTTYEVMRERVRESVQEMEQKNKQLEEFTQQLKGSRDFLQTIIDSLEEELMVLDSNRRIIQANRSMRLKHGDRKVIGHYCYEVTHQASRPCDSPSCTCPFEKAWQKQTPTRVLHVHSVSPVGTGKDRYIEVSAAPVSDSRGKVTQVIEITRDVSESKELENRILEANRHLLALNALSRTVSQSLSLDVILNSALDKALELMGTQAGGILLLDPKTQTFSYQIHRGLSQQFVHGVRIAGLRLGEGIAGHVAEQGETFVLDDISRDTQAAHLLAVEEDLKAFVSVPLKSKQRIVGVLNIASRKPRSFSREEVQLLSALGDQLGVAIENAQLYKDLQAKEQMRGELLRQIISAQEDERRRIARELHDVTSQSLATLAVRLQAIGVAPESSSEQIESHLEAIRALLATTSQEVHRLIYKLRPTLLDDLGLAAAVRSCAHDSLDAAGTGVHVEVVGEEKKLPAEVEISLFRIAQEAIANVTRHAQAESVYVILEFKDKGVAIQVEDDGIGFDISKWPTATSAEHRAGLLGMKERAELLGGTLTIDTKPGRGTKVIAEIPVEWGQSDVQD